MKPFINKFGVLTVGIGAFASYRVAALPFSSGDVFAAVASGQVQHYDSSLNLLETLDTTLGGFTTGMAFDGSGDLYVTGFSASAVSVFSQPTGALLGTFGSGYSTPESLVFNTAGEAYVGNLGGFILKKDSAGGALATYSTGRIDWLDLAANQSTIYFTTEGRTIFRYDVSGAGAFLSDFATLPGAGEAFALRILSDGGVLVADGDNIKRLDSSGSVVQTYDSGANDNWFALNLAPDGTSFLSGDFGSAEIVKFDIASGSVLDSVNTGTGGSTLFGLAVAGEITAGGPPPPDVPEAGTYAAGAFLAGLASLGWYRRRSAK